MTETWRKRFTAPTVTLPFWARERPERCAYFSNASGSWQMYAWDRSTDAHRRATDAVKGTQNGHLDWRGETLWWFDDRTGSEAGRWMRQPFEGGAWRDAFPELPDGRGFGLLVGDGFQLVLLSLPTGFTLVRADEGQPPRELYRHARQPAFLGKLSRDQALFCLAHSEGGRSDKPDLRVCTVDGDVVAEATDGPEMALRPGGWSPVAGDQRLIVFHERDDFPRPELWSPRRNEREALPIDLPGAVTASWYPDATALLLVHSHHGRGELYRYELATAALERIPTPAGVIPEARVREDGEVWYAWQSSARSTEVRGPSGVVLAPPGEGRPDGVAFSSHFVGDVQVFLAEPPGGGPFPTVFQVHGGPAGQDTDMYRPNTQALVDHGYVVAMVNYHGSSGYGRAWRDSLVGNPGLPELEDIAAVRRWLVERGTADPERTVIAGASWGGYLTLLGLGRQPELWAAGIAIVPIGDWTANYEDSAPMLQAYNRALFGGAPTDQPELFRERSPITYAANVRAPLLVMAGENDPRCPIRQVEMYVSRLTELGRSPEVYRYDGGHGTLLIDEQIRQTEKMLAFLAKHLQKVAAPD